jgi:hypothetical protein
MRRMRRRFNPIEILLVVILISPALIFVCRAEEQITITTYYPAPNGIYREMRADQMSIGSAYRTSTLSDGNIIISGRVGIGSSNNPPAGKLDAVMADGTSRVTINDDNNAGIDLRGLGGNPYIDFSDDTGMNYAVRLRLVRDSGTPYLKLDGGRLVNTIGCIRYTFTPTSGIQNCPAGTAISQAPMTPAGTDGFFLCCNYVNNGTALAW